MASIGKGTAIRAYLACGDLLLSLSSTWSWSPASIEGRGDKAEVVHENQIIAVMYEHEAGAKAGDLARKHGVSAATLHSWKAKHGGLDVSDAKRLKAQKTRTRSWRSCWPIRCWKPRHVASFFQKRWGRRHPRSVAHLQAVMGLSGRRACSFVGADRKMIRYRSCCPRRPNCAVGYGISPTSGDALTVVACSSCCGGKANRLASTASGGYTGKQG